MSISPGVFPPPPGIKKHSVCKVPDAQDNYLYILVTFAPSIHLPREITELFLDLQKNKKTKNKLFVT